MPWPTFDEALPRLESVKELPPERADGGRRVLCLCPAHEDDRESLIVIESLKYGGRAIFQCRAYCEKEAVCAALGFDPAEAPATHPAHRTAQAVRAKQKLHERKHLEEYEYRLADGSLNFAVVRHTVPKKDFRQYRVDPITGEIIRNLKGVTRSLFRLERLISRGPIKTLWVVEGEHDVLNIEIMGADATTKSGGAGSSWSEVLIDQMMSLKPDRIGIICDNDKSGFKSGINLHELLKQRGFTEVGLFKPQPAVDKADVTTHFEAGHTIKDLMPLTDEERLLGKKKEIPVRIASSLDCTENGAAIYLERVIGDQVMYVPGCDEPWHYLRAGIWVADRDEVEALARSAFEKRVLQAYNAGDEGLLASAMRFASRRGIDNALYLMKNTVKVQVGELGELANPHLVAVGNGVVDLRTGVLQNHDPTLHFTMQIKSELNKNNKCPRWLAFLKEVQPDKQVRLWLQKFFGACLSGEMPQIVVCNIGTGLNGKSVAINTVMSVLGTYAGTADASTFMSGRSLGANEQRSDLTRLRGKRMVSSTETDAGASLNEGFIKSWCGGEEILARAMYAKTPISYEPQGKLVLTSNHRPRIKEQDLGVWRRIRLVPWSVRIKAVDDRIQEKLREETAGVLNWLVAGAVAFYEFGLDKLPPIIGNATSDYQADEDEIGEFLFECCELGPDHTILSADLYSVYVRWSDGGAVRPMSKNKFGRRLTQRGLVPARSAADPDNKNKKAGSRQWEGIHLNEETRWSF